MTAAIPVPLTPEEQATLLARAKAQGVSVDALLRRAVLQIIYSSEASEPSSSKQLSGDEFECALEELGDLIPDNIPPIPEEALRRENMYSREDEW